MAEVLSVRQMSPLQEKIARTARFDGVSLVAMAFLSLVCAAIWRDTTGAMVGLALFTLGGIELHGRSLLLHRQARAVGWLVGSQVGLLLVILAYCLRSISHPPNFSLQQLPADTLTMLQLIPNFSESSSLLDEMLPAVSKVVYALFMLISVLYQGHMAMFYLRKTPRALLEPPILPID